MALLATASVRALAPAEAMGGAGTGDVEESETDFIDVLELQKLGINAADITKLKSGGLHTVGRILSTPTKALLAIKGISDAKVEKILEAARKLVPTGFVTGSEALLKAKSRIKITTGSKELDTILGGGYETGTITEIFGEYRSGKTQLVSTLAVTSQLGRDHGGGAGKVIVIDTENGFRPDRVGEIATKRFGLDPTQILDNLLVAQAMTHEHQNELITMAAAKIAEDDEPYRVMIVDSIMGLYRVEFSGRGELAERQQKLGGHIHELRKIAEEFNIAVVVTNQVTADPGNMFVADAKKPIGGNILGHYVDTRIYVRKGKGNNRVAKIYAGPYPEVECNFAVSEAGVVDPE